MTATTVPTLDASWLWPLLRWVLALLAIALALAPGRVGGAVSGALPDLAPLAAAGHDTGSLFAAVPALPATPGEPPPGAPPNPPGPIGDCL